MPCPFGERSLPDSGVPKGAQRAGRAGLDPKVAPWGRGEREKTPVKLWGMALIVLSGLLAGLLVASRLKRRVRLLLDLKALLQGFSTGIRFCSGSLSELIVEHQESPFCRQAEREPEFPEDPAAPWNRQAGFCCGRPETWNGIRGWCGGWGSAIPKGSWSISPCTSLVGTPAGAGSGRSSSEMPCTGCLRAFSGIVLSLLLL